MIPVIQQNQKKFKKLREKNRQDLVVTAIIIFKTSFDCISAIRGEWVGLNQKYIFLDPIN